MSFSFESYISITERDGGREVIRWKHNKRANIVLFQRPPDADPEQTAKALEILQGAALVTGMPLVNFDELSERLEVAPMPPEDELGWDREHEKDLKFWVTDYARGTRFEMTVGVWKGAKS